ncbi:hypothetical protein THOM_2495 [Trachipleistophora hominis]|uniref:Uncharacterized protein n=1 Tax=Trachipleistophora hominis TaxID=72359 RepID=L7JUZ1_TRAHO|nr:hypothetical protein THOM_2495 [Trachipleistophora hominis]
MNHQKKVISLILISTLCSLIICQLNIIFTVVIDVFVFGFYVLMKSVFEAVVMNQTDIKNEVMEYNNKIKMTRERIEQKNMSNKIVSMPSSSSIS